MKVLEYWNNFPAIEAYWHHLNVTIQILIAMISLVSNIIVLTYLIK